MSCCFPRKAKKATRVSQEPADGPSYKFTYFNGRARGEVSRMLFAVAEVPYEDKRIEFPDWPAIKHTTPLGSLPVLEINGKSMESAQAINRYLARKFGLCGKNNWEQTQVDVVCEVCLDLWTSCTKAIFEKDETKQKESWQKIFEEFGPRQLGFLEKLICENANGNSFFVGQNVTVADIWFLVTMDYYMMPGMNENGLSEYPKLQSLRNRVASHKQIAAWIAKRPKTDL